MTSRNGTASSPGDGRHREGTRPRRFTFALLLASVSLLLAIAGASSALADESAAPSYVPTLQNYKEGLSTDPGLQATGSELTDPTAAEELPHRDLGREEALELLRKTFGTELQSPAGIFAELEVEKFLSNNVAVIAAGNQPEPAGIVIGEEDPAEEPQPTLLDSTVPLRAPGLLGREEAVDLDLEHAEGEIQPTNPLTEVSIPTELGEGIELPKSGIGIELAGAPEERAPSITEQSVAVYPNVAKDTDFAVAPTPTGIETLTQIRSAEAPRSETLELSLPEGASLTEAQGGAEVTKDGETLAMVAPPTAMDANGDPVPVSLEVSGNSLTYTASPGPQAAYPILLDPLIDEYVWGSGTYTHIEDWKSEVTYASPFTTYYGAACSTWCQGYLAAGSPGLWIASWAGISNWANAQGGFYYHVPRYQTDWNNKYTSSTWISQAKYFALSFQHRSDANASPYLVGGLWMPAQNQFKTSFWRGGNEANLSLDSQPYTMLGGSGSQEASFAMVSSDGHALGATRDAWMGWANIELTDPDHPRWTAPEVNSQWVNNSPTAPITFGTFSDAGLGVYSITASDKSGHSWKTLFGCTGIASSPCPRTWSESGSGQPKLTYDPSVLPQGIDTLELVASDPVGHASNAPVGEEEAGYATAQVKVDHTAPTLTLSGSMTEQASLGTSLPQYTLRYVAKDGTTASPQSGIATAEVKVDGKLVDSAAPNCTTKNCEVSREWTLQSSAYSPGTHTVVVKVKDAVGLTAEKTLTFSISRDTTAPQISATNAFYTAPEGWLEQKSYNYNAQATDEKGSGITSLTLKIDNATVKTVTQTCPTGACSKSLGVSNINMATYKGGEHPAELIAVDGAGNVAKKAWTINVDPSGEVSNTEVTQTLEAVEGTEPDTSVVAPTDEVIEKGEREEGNNPGLTRAGEELTSTGTPTKSTISVDPTDGVTVDAPETNIHIEPVGAAESEDAALVAEEVAAVTANTNKATDTIIRPKYDGVMYFESIRDASAPESYSWEVRMAEGMTLKELDSEHAAFFYEDGTEAGLIATEIAHDAVGNRVPTTLTVSDGNIITLTVHHRGGGYVYPVVAGHAVEVGYEAVVDLNPSGEPQEHEPLEGGTVQVSAPISVATGDGSSDDDATISRTRKGYEAEFTEPTCSGLTGCTLWEVAMKGKFYYNKAYVWWRASDPPPVCKPWTNVNVHYARESCGWVGYNHQPYGHGYHISDQARFSITKEFLQLSKTDYHAATIYIYGSGYVSRAHDTESLCNPLSSC